MPRILELFCGHADVSRVFRDKGWDTVTVDFDEKHNADIIHDIIHWDYTTFPKDHFDFIWASPDCRSWSLSSNRHHNLYNNLKPESECAVLGEKMIHATHAIIDYFQPYVYCIENPRARLRSWPPMARHPFRTTVYYNNHGFKYVKPTDLWSNIPLWEEERKPSTMLWKYCKTTQSSLIPVPLVEKLYHHVNECVYSVV